MVPLWFFMSLWMVDTSARLLCHLGASCPLHQRRNFPGKFASSPVPDANEVQNLLQDLWAHLWTGILRNPCSSWWWLSWCVFAAPTSTWGWNPARPWAPQGAEPASSQLIPHSSLNLALRWVLISGWQVSPTVLFLKLSKYSWAFYTNCRNCLKPSVWNLGQILVRISSNYWINFRELWCLCGLSLVNIGAIFLCFLEVRVNKLHAPSQFLLDKAYLGAFGGFLVWVDVVTEGSFPATFSRWTLPLRLRLCLLQHSSQT